MALKTPTSPCLVLLVTVTLLYCASANGQGKYNDACLQHRDCIFYQYCSGNEFSCCAPAYDDATNSLYCWCCKQDCQYVEGNYCRNASAYYSSVGTYNRDQEGINSTISSEMDSGTSNQRRRIIPQKRQPSQLQSNKTEMSPSQEKSDKIINGHRIQMTF